MNDLSFTTLLPWIVFHILIVLLLLFDLLFLHRNPREIKFKEALFWSGFYISLALAFNIGVYFLKGPKSALEFFTGYLIENSLSIDNLFVFISIFTIFGVPRIYQHRVLFWGIIAAVIMRAFFIFAGIALVNSFHWVMYIFGIFLVFTGIKLFFQKEEESLDPKNYWAVKLSKRWLPFTDSYQGECFFVPKVKGVHKKSICGWVGTPMLLVLIVIDIVDIIFAVDSVPAVIAVTTDPFIVYTSNIFAILGLRSMYFALAGLIPLFHYLKYALSIILVFVGVKLAISNIYPIATTISLLFIASVFVLSIVLSLSFPPPPTKDAGIKGM